MSSQTSFVRLKKMKNSCRPKILTALFAIGFFVCFSVPAFAETVSAYRDKINKAMDAVDELIYSEDDEEKPTPVRNSPQKRQQLKEARQSLPPSEKVESNGVSVETQNKWFSERLDDYEKEENAEKRYTILNEIYERLEALETEVNALEKASSAAPTKDDDKLKLASILRRPEYQKPEEQQENIIQKTWRKIREWLSEFFPKTSPFSLPDEGLSSLSFIIQLVIYAVVLGIIGFILYKFAPLLRARFSRRGKESKSERVVLGETLAADADSHTLFTEAETLAREGNLRAAIRKGYIALLCDLSDRKIIGLARHKTNRDYLRDVRPRQEIFGDMNSLTTNFERNWYGFGQTEEKDWNDFKEKYFSVSKRM